MFRLLLRELSEWNDQNVEIDVCTIGSKALQRALERDLVAAKSNRFPLFQGVHADLSSHSRDYRRISLPLASGGNDVTHLLVGVHFEQ